jgi:hypothetical protein
MEVSVTPCVLTCTRLLRMVFRRSVQDSFIILQKHVEEGNQVELTGRETRCFVGWNGIALCTVSSSFADLQKMRVSVDLFTLPAN